MSSWVLRPAWFNRITWSTCDASNFRSLALMVSGDPMSPPACMVSNWGLRRNAWYSSQRLMAPGTPGGRVE
jgi:hypothetical protein